MLSPIPTKIIVELTLLSDNDLIKSANDERVFSLIILSNSSKIKN